MEAKLSVVDAKLDAVVSTNYLCVKEEDGRITIVTRVKKRGEWFPVGSTTLSQEQAIKLHEDLTELIFDHYFV